MTLQQAYLVASTNERNQMKTPSKEQLAASLEAFHYHIGDWLEDHQDSISTEELVERILLAALNNE